MNPTTIALATIGAVVALITPALLLGLARSGSEHRRPTPKQGTPPTPATATEQHRPPSKQGAPR